METWQKDHIRKHMPDLLINTECTAMFLANLFKDGIISMEETNILANIQNRMQQANRFYEIVQTRTASYNFLKQALQDTFQTGALKILNTCYDRNIPAQFKNYGTIIYYKDKLLGRGCYNTKVFRGKFENRDVAVKVISTDDVEPEDALKEVHFHTTLDWHVNVVRYYKTEISEDFVFIALELCDTNLFDWVIKLKNVEIDVVDVIKQATKGVAYLHSHRVFHRDLKPANILLARPAIGKVRVKISDFGMSKRIPDGISKLSRHTSGIGTEGWMAPEVARLMMRQVRGQRTVAVGMGLASDVFSLGCIYYFLLTGGIHPFGDPVRCQGNILDGKSNLMLEEVTEVEFGAEQGYISLIQKMLSHEYEDRPSTPEVLSHLANMNININQGGEAAGPPLEKRNDDVASIEEDIISPIQLVSSDRESEPMNNCLVNNDSGVMSDRDADTFPDSTDDGNEDGDFNQAPVAITENSTSEFIPSWQTNLGIHDKVEASSISEVNLDLQPPPIPSTPIPSRDVTSDLPVDIYMHNNDSGVMSVPDDDPVSNRGEAGKEVTESPVATPEPDPKPNLKILSRPPGIREFTESSVPERVSIMDMVIQLQNEAIESMTPVPRFEDSILASTKSVLVNNLANEFENKAASSKSLLPPDTENPLAATKNVSVSNLAKEFENKPTTSKSPFHGPVSRHRKSVLASTKSVSVSDLTSEFLDQATTSRNPVPKPRYARTIGRLVSVKSEGNLAANESNGSTFSRDITRGEIAGRSKPTHLPLAVKEQNMARVEELIRNGEDVNARYKYSKTALHLAASCLNKQISLKMSKYLIDNGADFFARDASGQTYLHILLCGDNADYYQFVDDQESIFPTVELDEATLVRIRNCGIHFQGMRDKSGDSILFNAVRGAKCSQAFLSSLVKIGLDWMETNRQQQTLLHIAAINKIGSRSLSFLLDLGLDPNAVDAGGKTPLGYSLRPGNLENIILLLEFGANKGLLQGEQIKPVELISQKNEYSFDFLRKIKNLGLDLKGTNKQRQSLLHLAAKNLDIHTESFTFILNLGLYINEVDAMGKTPLHYILDPSKDIHRFDLALELVRKGADVHLHVQNKETPMDYLLKHKHNYPHYSFINPLHRVGNPTHKAIKNVEGSFFTNEASLQANRDSFDKLIKMLA